MELRTKIILQTTKSTLSRLYVNGEEICFTLEDGHKEVKVPGETRIPRGRYKIEKRQVGQIYTKQHQRHGFQFVPHLIDVPNFKYVLIHIGNEIEDTRGCLLVGETFGYKTNYTKDTDVIRLNNSTKAFEKLYKMLDAAFRRGEEVWIELEEPTELNENSNLNYV